MLKRFFSTQIYENQCIIDEDESHHCHHVLRCKKGEKIEIIDGKGHLYHGIIQAMESKKCIISDLHIHHYEGNRHTLTVAVCPPKNPSRLEWLLEKGTEIGVHQIVLIHSTRTERFHPKMQRYKQIILSAVKQSQQLWLPEIQIFTFDQFIKNPTTSLCCIAHCMADVRQSFFKVYNQELPTTILIGPEGDFTPAEVEMAIKHGYIPVHLGSSRLRTETAAIQACAWYNIDKEN